jgi:hypothetical protein
MQLSILVPHGPLVSLTTGLSLREDLVSCVFPSLSSINTVPNQQITINERVVNALRLHGEVCIRSALPIDTTR